MHDTVTELHAVGRHAVGARDERGVELIDVGRGVLELAREILPGQLALISGRVDGRILLRTPGLALFGAFAIPCHDELPASGSPCGWYASGTTCSTCAA